MSETANPPDRMLETPAAEGRKSSGWGSVTSDTPAAQKAMMSATFSVVVQRWKPPDVRCVLACTSDSTTTSPTASHRAGSAGKTDDR